MSNPRIMKRRREKQLGTKREKEKAKRRREKGRRMLNNGSFSSLEILASRRLKKRYKNILNLPPASYHRYDFLLRKQHRLKLPSPEALHFLSFLPPLSFKLVLNFIIQSSKVERSMSSLLLVVVDQVRIGRRRFRKGISEWADRERERPKGRKRWAAEKKKTP